MLQRGRIGEGWLGELHVGEDVQGRPVRFIPLVDWNEAERQWLLDRMKLMNTHSVMGACPQLGLQVVQGDPSWVAAWRDGVQLSVVLEHKHMPNTVIMSVVYGILQSLHSAQQKGLMHGALHSNGIWLGLDGVVWIDGFGQYPNERTDSTQDVYVLGCLLIEMFLGECPFPVPKAEHRQTLINVGLELKALGLPSKLPRQIVRLVHPDASKRPSLEVLIEKWKITRGQTIVASWVREQYPQLINESKPENRIPTATRIAPKPTPSELKTPDSKVSDMLEDDETFIGDHSVIEASNDETLRWDEEHTEEALIEHSEESVEETQVMKFFAEFDAHVPNAEPTSKLVVDANLVSEDVVEVEKVSLAEEMDIPSRRPWMGVLWIGIVGVLTGGGLYWTMPNIPSFAETSLGDIDKDLEAQTEKAIAFEAVPIPSRANDLQKSEGGKDNDNENAATAKVTNAVVTPTAPVMTQPTSTNATKPSNRTVANPVSKLNQQTKRPSNNVQSPSKSEEKVLSQPRAVPSQNTETNPVVNSTAPQDVEKSDDVSVETIESVKAIESPKPQTGTVSVTGEVKTVRLEKDGRDFKPGQLPVGVYTVYVTFEGFNEFKASSLTVKTDGKHRIECDSMFATCQVK